MSGGLGIQGNKETVGGIYRGPLSRLVPFYLLLSLGRTPLCNRWALFHVLDSPRSFFYGHLTSKTAHDHAYESRLNTIYFIRISTKKGPAKDTYPSSMSDRRYYRILGRSDPSFPYGFIFLSLGAVYQGRP